MAIAYVCGDPPAPEVRAWGLMDLYRRSPELRGFLAAWRADYRCPLELVDYLLEQDLPLAAAAARWAATAAPQRRYDYDPNYTRGPELSGPYPCYQKVVTFQYGAGSKAQGPYWYWLYLDRPTYSVCSDNVFARYFFEDFGAWYTLARYAHTTWESSVVALLANWCLVPDVEGDYGFDE